MLSYDNIMIIYYPLRYFCAHDIVLPARDNTIVMLRLKPSTGCLDSVTSDTKGTLQSARTPVGRRS